VAPIAEAPEGGKPVFAMEVTDNLLSLPDRRG
jgi:hypothetical protein